MKSNEVVVITGASAGIGRAVAMEFARKGAKIGILARGEKSLNSTKNDIIAAGGEAHIISVDVSNAQAIDDAAQKIEDVYGPIDIWINCAMTTVFSEFINITPDEFHRITEVTYLGFVYGTHAALKRMMPRNHGAIIQVGSALAYRAIPLQSAYCGAKHAIRGFTDSVRSELLHNKSKVKISMVQLPAVNTPQFDWCKNNMNHKSQPVPPIFEPELIARHIFWAAHHHRRELLLGFNVWVIVWGNKLFPGLGDWYLGKTGYKSQQYNGAPDPNQQYNLWKPVDSDPGIRGSFSNKSTNQSFYMNLIHLPVNLILSVVLFVLSTFSSLTVYSKIRRINSARQ
jgi:short-subunit dehydrogenase